MWRATLLTAALLAVVLAVQFWPSGQNGVLKQSLPSSQSRLTRTAMSDSACGKAILRDWVSAGRIDGTYSRSCYQAARRMIPEDGGHLYGSGGALIEALEKPR